MQLQCLPTLYCFVRRPLQFLLSMYITCVNVFSLILLQYYLYIYNNIYKYIYILLLNNNTILLFRNEWCRIKYSNSVSLVPPQLDIEWSYYMATNNVKIKLRNRPLIHFNYEACQVLREIVSFIVSVILSAIIF